MLLVNLYAANWDDVDFMNRFFWIHSYFGGNFNCVVDPMLDKSEARCITHYKMAQSLSFLWRKIDVLIRGDLATFSQLDQSLSRIDFFYIDQYFSKFN